MTAPTAPRRVRLGVVTSTNDEAKRLADAGAAEGTFVTAEIQTRGRGRRGAAWSSPAGNLHMSIILRPECPAARAGQVGFVAALALAATFDRVLPAKAAVRLKWPNDVLIDGRKAAGILLETSTVGSGAVAWLVVGIGVNVASAPASAARPATSLAAAGASVSVDALADMVARALLHGHERWRRVGFGPVREAWLARAFGLGARADVNLDHERFEAQFVGLDDSGALIAELPGGARRAISAGEVFFRGAA
ncbi:MAG: biotin--[acetyl-CoA-carboxylase] ligase [Alphaproteobacteria bacterium]